MTKCVKESDSSDKNCQEIETPYSNLFFFFLNKEKKKNTCAIMQLLKCISIYDYRLNSLSSTTSY